MLEKENSLMLKDAVVTVRDWISSRLILLQNIQKDSYYNLTPAEFVRKDSNWSKIKELRHQNNGNLMGAIKQLVGTDETTRWVNSVTTAARRRFKADDKSNR